MGCIRNWRDRYGLCAWSASGCFTFEEKVGRMPLLLQTSQPTAATPSRTVSKSLQTSQSTAASASRTVPKSLQTSQSTAATTSRTVPKSLQTSQFTALPQSTSAYVANNSYSCGIVWWSMHAEWCCTNWILVWAYNGLFIPAHTDITRQVFSVASAPSRWPSHFS